MTILLHTMTNQAHKKQTFMHNRICKLEQYIFKNIL